MVLAAWTCAVLGLTSSGTSISKAAAIDAEEGADLAFAVFHYEQAKIGKDSPDPAALNTVEDAGIKAVIDATSELTGYDSADTGGYGYSGKFEGNVIVGFEGTDFTSLSDIQADLGSLVSMAVDLGGTTYSAGDGFVTQYLGLKLAGMDSFFGTIAAGSLVRVVGHSLGGALANLCAVELANRGMRVFLQTYGSPRAFDSQEDNSYARAQSLTVSPTSDWSESVTAIPTGKILVQRLVNYGDSIPSVPQSTFGWSHIGHGGIYVNQPIGVGTSMECTIESQDFTPYQDGSPFTAANHLLGSYQSRITSCAAAISEDTTEPAAAEDQPCFGRETTTACRLSDAGVSPEAAFDQCFGTDTPQTAQRVLLAELRAGDHVLSEAGKASRVVFNQHIVTANEGKSVMLTIRHEAGYLEVTPDHVIEADGAFVAAHEVKPGSMLGSYEVKAVSRGVGGVINPITVAGKILVAGKEGKPVMASTYPEWIAERMLKSAMPLPLSLSNLLSYLFPATAQAFYDAHIEPLFPAAGGSYRKYLEAVPTALSPLAFVVSDLFVSFAIVLVSLGPVAVLATLAAAAFVAKRK